jgi:hypothetical protein
LNLHSYSGVHSGEVRGAGVEPLPWGNSPTPLLYSITVVTAKEPV